MSDEYMCELFKYPKLSVSLVDARRENCYNI